jgi:predicted  nucleic acid-binding Zn-ribbon protein
MGESYFGFCQAIAENQVPCVAYAVDTWVGEAHAGFYDNSVYEDVYAHNQANYSSFSYLLRSLFDDALQNFAESSIDVLHIDGLHTFEAVAHDFYSWLPKVKPGGIVLLHDICVRHLDFGVWKLWENLKTEGEAFEFHHSWGLGVFRKPGSSLPESELLKALFGNSAEVQEQVRRYYTLAASDLEWKYRAEKGTAEDNPRLQVYPPSENGYQEATSQTVTIIPNQWQAVSIDIPEGVSTGALRLDPAERPAVIDVRGITLISAVDQRPVWSSTGSELSKLGLGGTLMLIDSTENGACRLLSYGKDPQIYLPLPEGGLFDQPLTLRIWLRLQTELDALTPLLNESGKCKALPEDSELLEKLKARMETVTQELEREIAAAAALRSDLEASQRDRERLVDDLNKKQTRLYLLEDLRHEVKQENNELRERFVQLEKTYLDLKEKTKLLETAYAELQTSHEELARQHQVREALFADVLRSRSWRLTSPLRSVTERLKSRSASGNSN